MYVIDISKPTAPVLTGSLSSGLGTFDYGFTISGKYAYITESSGNLYTVDISNPAAPVLVDSLISSGTWYSVYVSGKFAYVADSTGVLRIINISSSTNAVQVGSLGVLGGIRSVYVSGDYAYVASGVSSTLSVVDVSSSTRPFLVGAFTGLDVPYHVTLAGKYAYISNFGAAAGSFSIVDLKGADISAATIGNISTNDLTIWENADVGNNLYVRNGLNVGVGGIFTDGGVNANGTSTFAINPSSTVGIGTNAPQAKLHVFDGTLLVDNPIHPTLVSIYDDPKSMDGNGLDVAGKYAYYGDAFGSHMFIVDVSNPAYPVKVGVASSTLLSGIENIRVVGHYAYATSYNKNLLAVIDVADPTIPTIVGYVSSTALSSSLPKEFVNILIIFSL